jgi:hypothetical protein
MVLEPGDRVSKAHLLRRVKELADAALTRLSALFDGMYSAIGRPSILRAIPIQHQSARHDCVRRLRLD